MKIMKNKEYLNLKIKICEKTIMKFNGLITQRLIVDLAKTVEDALVELDVDDTKIQTIFILLVEIMQNILSHSINSKDLGNNTCQCMGNIHVSLDKSNEIYKIRSENLISKTEKEHIVTLLEEANSLDADGLKSLYKKRRRNKNRNHHSSAGLGFLDMARKSKNKLSFKFSENNKESLMIELEIKI